MNDLKDAINRNRAWYCLECGKCSAVCPITRWEKRGFASPRLLIETAMEGQREALFEAPLFWSCLTCKRCSELCPSDVYFSEFIRDMRKLARDEGHAGSCTHGDVIQTWGRMMTDPDLRQNRLGWMTNELEISDDSDTLFFVGCLPLYQTLFRELNIEGTDTARATVKILNHLGIAPQVMADERCCGHDQLWEGELDTFKSLAELNMKRLEATGAKRIVTACPECARTLGVDYPQWVGSHHMQVYHMSQFLSENLEALEFKPPSTTQNVSVTFHDPCRLGRHLGVYDDPRNLIAAMGIQVVEMEHSRNTALCCGTSCWTACGQVNKNIQMERLKEAKATGADRLITACSKCQIHFRCAQQDDTLSDDMDIQIQDLTTLVARRLMQKKVNDNPLEESHAEQSGAR